MARKRTVGPVTAAASAGGGVGYAIADILVHFFPTLEPISGPLGMMITVGLGIIFGYLVPPKDYGEPDQFDEPDDFHGPDAFDEAVAETE